MVSKFENAPTSSDLEIAHINKLNRLISMVEQVRSSINIYGLESVNNWFSLLLHCTLLVIILLV